MQLRMRGILCLGLLLMVSNAGAANTADINQCLLDAIEQAADSDSVKMLRDRCAVSEDSADQITVVSDKPEQSRSSPSRPGLIERRLHLEQQAADNRFAILQHKSSYILPVTYNDKVNNAPFAAANGESDLNQTEVKFQFSLKAQLMDEILNTRGRLFVAYTNLSYWQIYDQENSGPFRETNHEPEFFVDFDQNYSWAGWHIPLIRTGWVHQSNGQSTELSRSWNRIFGQVFLEKENWALSFKPWVRVNGDSAEEDNPDIDDFMGNFELGVFRQGAHSTASILLRNNLRSENRGAIEFNWSRELPRNKKVRLFLQYFHGYGESLIDYDVVTNRIGLGLQLSDFL